MTHNKVKQKMGGKTMGRECVTKRPAKRSFNTFLLSNESTIASTPPILSIVTYYTICNRNIFSAFSRLCGFASWDLQAVQHKHFFHISLFFHTSPLYIWWLNFIHIISTVIVKYCTFDHGEIRTTHCDPSQPPPTIYRSPSICTLRLVHPVLNMYQHLIYFLCTRWCAFLSVFVVFRKVFLLAHGVAKSKIFIKVDNTNARLVGDTLDYCVVDGKKGGWRCGWGREG